MYALSIAIGSHYSFFDYARAIVAESADWSKGAIVDVVATSSSACPPDYEAVTAHFPGTSNYCQVWLSGDILMGDCSS
jgi:hypothetical protein